MIFLATEGKTTEPLVVPGPLRRRNIAWGNIAGLLGFATMTSLDFLLTLYLQEILTYNAITAGLILRVPGNGTVLGGLVAPRIIGAANPKVTIVLGFLLQAAATVPLAFLSDSRGWLIPLLITTFIGGVANLIAIVGYTVTSTMGVDAELLDRIDHAAAPDVDLGCDAEGIDPVPGLLDIARSAHPHVAVIAACLRHSQNPGSVAQQARKVSAADMKPRPVPRCPARQWYLHPP